MGKNNGFSTRESEPVDKGTWKEDLKSNATMRVLLGHWAFKIKRSSDGVPKKWKA